MTIYQVINKQNQLEYAYLNYEVAIAEIAKLHGSTSGFTINAVQDEEF